VNLGFLSGTKLPEGVDIGAFVFKRLRFEGSSLRSRDEVYQGKLRDRLEEYVEKFGEGGEFKVYVDRVFRWEEVAEAHRYMESDGSKGKIICTID
jgi:NADPH:quinone reductase-like Zn-dependent oxidoreductase